MEAGTRLRQSLLGCRQCQSYKPLSQQKDPETTPQPAPAHLNPLLVGCNLRTEMGGDAPLLTGELLGRVAVTPLRSLHCALPEMAPNPGLSGHVLAPTAGPCLPGVVSATPTDTSEAWGGAVVRDCLCLSQAVLTRTWVRGSHRIGSCSARCPRSRRLRRVPHGAGPGHTKEGRPWGQRGPCVQQQSTDAE